jgi:MoaA/NifB/PqqE/SkfB family radical SAM enzyme
MSSALLRRILGAPETLALKLTDQGPTGDLAVPSAGDGAWQIAHVDGRAFLTPAESSYYLYFVVPQAFRRRAAHGLWLEVEYYGERFAEFRVQYASSDRNEPHAGLYKPAQQRYRGDAPGKRQLRRALFPMPDFDPSREQNHGASFRIEFRREVLVHAVELHAKPPKHVDSFAEIAPLPELKKLPGRFYPINYLFVEITNACNFKCTWCPDEVMDRKRGFMAKEKAFRLFDEIAEKRASLGPLYPVKLHQMGEPMLHPELPEIVGYAESHGVPIELNTNCGLITEQKIDALYSAGLTNLILSYQTPDLLSFKTRKAPRLAFDEYRDKVRLAVERKVAMKTARTNIEIDIMNTKHADGVTIVSEDQQAVAFLEDWIAFCRGLEQKYGLPPRPHDMEAIRAKRFLDQDEDGSRYELLPGVTLIWKRCHSWGNIIGGHKLNKDVDTYCPAPYDQFVVHWNGDVAACCTDYEGRTKYANVFRQSIESVWRGEILKRRRRDMLEGRLLDVCAKCIGVK